MKPNHTPMAVALSMVIATLTQPLRAVAQETSVLEEVVITGTRSHKPRSPTDSPVPVDVLSAEDFNSMGNTADLTDNLKALVPSYTATPATGDGSAFIRPTSLRGTAPDQSLVLVNGKRRHRSALVQFFAPAAGNGAHGVDIGMIPSIALKSVEVLRDGAAAQYGSDAIAGVMNFITKDADEGGSVQVQYGEFFDDESTTKVGANAGFSLGGRGFVNLSAEWWENDALSRGVQRPDAQALIDAGNQGVGADTPFDDKPFAQSWGRPETDGYRLFLNSGYDVNDNMEAYFFGNYADTDGRYRFFYRNTSHSTLQSLVDNFGYDGPLLQTGYTPYLDGDQTDFSLVGGLRGNFPNEIYYDFSASFGKSELEYFLNNTTNPSLGLGSDGEPAQRGFDVGGYEQEEINLNADFSKALTEELHLGVGLEWREEQYTVNTGEPNSYEGDGSNGLNGFSPRDAGDFDRDNWAVYGDLEWDVTEDFLAQFAVRYEDFSDFGSTTNGKLAARYSATDWLTFRGAVSTGFHAPTPGQSNVRTTITTFDGVTGLQVEEGLVPPTSPIALANGGKELVEEEATNYSIGFTSDIGDFTNLTVDFYLIEVDDRIYRTGDIQTDSGQTISFYTNTLDVEHQGVDLVLTSSHEWTSGVDTTFTLAYNYNEIEVTDQTPVNGIDPVSEGNVEDIENNYPEDRFVLTAVTTFAQNWWFMARVNYYGEHYDERGRINADVDPSAEIDDIYYVDVELGWDVTENWNLTLGGSNIFDEFVDDIGPPNANRLSVGLQYPRRTAANYEGGSWYARAIYNF